MKITFLVEKWLCAFSIFLGIEQKKKKKNLNDGLNNGHLAFSVQL